MAETVTPAEAAPDQQPSSTASARESSSSLGEVVVTARRVSENLQRVPVAVSAFSQAQLNRLVVNNAQDLSKLSPSLQTTIASNNRYTLIPTIRGQGTSFGTAQSSVAIYFNNAPNFAPSYVDLQSVQVLKGPQGTLFGQTATGGAVLFTPQKPTASYDGYIKGQLGNYNYRMVEGAFGGPLFTDQLLFRVAGQIRLRDGFTKDYLSYTHSSRQDDNIDHSEWRISLVWKPTDNFEDYFMYAGNIDRSNGTGSMLYWTDPRFIPAASRTTIPANNPQLAANWLVETGALPPPGLSWQDLTAAALAQQVAAGPGATFSNTDRMSEIQFHGFVNQVNAQIFSNLSLHDTFSYYWARERGPGVDIDGSALPILDTIGALNADGSYYWRNGWPGSGQTPAPPPTFSNEIQLVGDNFSHKLKWQIGYFYFRQQQHNFEPLINLTYALDNPTNFWSSSAAVCGTVPTRCMPLTRLTNEASGLYGQATLEIVPGVHLTGGYRESWEFRQVDNTAGVGTSVTVNGQAVGLAVVTPPAAGSTITSVVVPRKAFGTYTVALDWQVNENTLLYITHRTGYKGGGINTNLLPNSPLFTFGPEGIKDIEGGIKSDLRLGGMRIRTDLAVYYDWYKDIQKSNVVPGSAATFTQNLANANILGVEFEANAVVNSWFDISGYLAYTDAKYVSWQENSFCSTQYWRPQCDAANNNGVGASTPVVVDHSGGRLLINGQVVTTFTPDPFQGTSKWRFGIQPAIHLNDWTGQDITISANVYYRSQFTQDVQPNSLFAGINLPHQTVLGMVSNPLLLPGYAVADLRVEWRHFLGTRADVAFQVTNLTNKIAALGTSGGTQVVGITPVTLTEPRMFYFEVRYPLR